MASVLPGGTETTPVRPSSSETAESAEIAAERLAAAFGIGMVPSLAGEPTTDSNGFDRSNA